MSAEAEKSSRDRFEEGENDRVRRGAKIAAGRQGSTF